MRHTLIGLLRPFWRPRQRANIPQMSHCLGDRIHKVIVLAAREYRHLLDHHIGPLFIGGEDKAFFKEMADRMHPRHLVDAAGIDEPDAPSFVCKQSAQFLGNAVAGRLVFDQQRIDLHAAAGLGDLFNEVMDLKPLLREGTRSDVEAALRSFVMTKPGHHLMTPEETQHTPFVMAGIGG